MIALLWAPVGYAQGVSEGVSAPLKLGDVPAEIEAKKPVLYTQAVDVDQLTVIEFDGTGTLDAEGLGANVWQKSHMNEVIPLIQSLPNRIYQPLTRSLTLKALLTNARPPEGVSDGRFFEARAYKLLQMGQLTEFSKLVLALPNTLSTPGLDKLRFHNFFAKNRGEEACRRVPRYVEDMPDDIFWQQAELLCLLDQQNIPQAAFKYRLLQEQETGFSPTFQRLLGAAFGEYNDDMVQTDLPEPWALMDVYLYLKSPYALSDEQVVAHLTTASPAVISVLAHSLQIDNSLRIWAAEQSERFGGFPLADLTKLYDSILMAAVDLTDAVGVYENAGANRTFAAIYQSLKGARNSRSFTQELTHVFSLDLDYAARSQLSRLFIGKVRDIPPSVEMADFADTAIQVLTLADSAEAALPWEGAKQQLAEKGKEPLPISSLYNPDVLKKVSEAGDTGQLPYGLRLNLYYLTTNKAFLNGINVDPLQIKEINLGASYLISTYSAENQMGNTYLSFLQEGVKNPLALRAFLQGLVMTGKEALVKQLYQEAVGFYLYE